MSLPMEHPLRELGHHLSQGYIDRVPPMGVECFIISWYSLGKGWHTYAAMLRMIIFSASECYVLLIN